MAATIVGAAVVVGVTATVLSNDSAQASPLTATVKGTAQTAQGVLPHAFLELATYPDSMAGVHGSSGGAHPNWVTYGPTSALRVPAHSLVTVTIKQYDTGGTITNPYFATVHGTVDGTMTVDGKTLTKVDPDRSGTRSRFTRRRPTRTRCSSACRCRPRPTTRRAAPNSDYPAPHVVTFSFITGGPGDYVWNCEYPCGDGYYAKFGGPMSTRGYMSGTFTVT